MKLRTQNRVPASAGQLRTLNRLAQAIARIGSRPDDSEQVRLQKAIQLNAAVLGGIPAQLLLALLTFSAGERAAAAIPAGFALFSALGVLYLGLTRRHFGLFKLTQLLVPLLSPFLATLALGGLSNTGFTIMWGLVAPLLALVTYGPRQALYWFLAFLSTVAICVLAQPFLRPANSFSPEMLSAISLFNIVLVSSMLFAALAFFIRQRDLAFGLLEIERAKAESLLLNVLPSDIATTLKNSDQLIAEQYEGASILFADVVNFTPMSARMSPMELVGLLNEVFSHFDTLVERYGVEKIKTIGDCYMVAAGVPRSRPDHAQVLTALALDIREYASRYDLGGQRLSLRIGLNSGPVVAGVIGRKKFIYDLWGDVVNTASRMESHGKAGVVQVAEETYRLIKDDFLCEPQGLVEVKGKGAMPVWHVIRRI